MSDLGSERSGRAPYAPPDPANPYGTGADVNHDTPGTRK